MLNIPLWRKCAIILLCLFGVYYSLPSIFPGLRNSVVAPLLPSAQVNLGLDLRGGSSLLLEVDAGEYKRMQISNTLNQLLAQLRKEGIRSSAGEISDTHFVFNLAKSSDTAAAQKITRNLLGYNVNINPNHTSIEVRYEPATLREMVSNLMVQTLEIVGRRVDETGTKEIDLQRQGESYILLQVPGVQDPKHLKELLGKTAKLTFHLVDDRANNTTGSVAPLGSRMLPLEEEAGRASMYVTVRSHPVMTGDMLVDAHASVNHLGTPVVNFQLNGLGAKIFGEFTKQNKGRRLAIVLDQHVLSAPVINEPILGGSGVISGSFTVKTAGDLALLLRAGALPAPIKVVEERVVGPSLGSDSIKAGQNAVVLGTCLVVIVMIVCYGLFGSFAVFAMVLNLFLTISILALIGATLTLPSIAGMVLTLGMAVDANVLICERIREELRMGKTPLAAIDSGYNTAFITIFDSNITTIIAAVLLYIFGTGPIRGFAVALIIGILCSMFTAIALTKLMMATWYRLYKPKTLPL